MIWSADLKKRSGDGASTGDGSNASTPSSNCWTYVPLATLANSLVLQRTATEEGDQIESTGKCLRNDHPTQRRQKNLRLLHLRDVVLGMRSAPKPH